MARTTLKAQKAAQARARAFPVQVFIVWDTTSPTHPVMLAETTPETAEDGAVVAIYTLQTVRRKRVVHSLEDD